MAGKTVSLQVHKNAKRRRHSKGVACTVRDCVSEAQHDLGELSGFVCVIWDENGQANCNWYGGCIPSNLVPAYTSDMLMRSVSRMDARRMMEGES